MSFASNAFYYLERRATKGKIRREIGRGTIVRQFYRELRTFMA